MSADLERAVRLDWNGTGLEFTGAGILPATPSILPDGGNRTGPGPMLLLLLACASCSGSDVVVILQKMRIQLKHMSVEVKGTRREQEPRRYVAIHFQFTLGGEGLTREQAERSVKLSLERYCSVVHSLASDIRITSAVELVE